MSPDHVPRLLRFIDIMPPQDDAHAPRDSALVVDEQDKDRMRIRELEDEVTFLAEKAAAACTSHTIVPVWHCFPRTAAISDLTLYSFG